MIHARALALGLALAGCGARAAPEVAKAPPRDVSGFRIVAEGPCGRLSAQVAGSRTFLVYGETGYDLHDWVVGERLAAAQSFVELRDGRAFRTPSLYRGLPLSEGGYVQADLFFGRSEEPEPWLLAVETRYAPRGAGRLFDRRSRAYARKGHAWAPSPHTSPAPLPGASADLPALPLETMCGSGALRFVPLASATTARGHVFVAGRCQDASHINYRETTLLVALGAPGATSWRVERAPDVTTMDGIVNLGLYARSGADAYLVAWEPFKPPDQRQSYLARWDGRAWSEIPTGVPEGLMSIAGTSDGTLWVAGGRALYKKPRGGRFEAVPLPPLRFATEPSPTTLRIHAVRTSDRDDVWVEGTYRVELPGKDGPTQARASVLWRRANEPAAPPLFCDAREPAEQALAAVEP